MLLSLCRAGAGRCLCVTSACCALSGERGLCLSRRFCFCRRTSDRASAKRASQRQTALTSQPRSSPSHDSHRATRGGAGHGRIRGHTHTTHPAARQRRFSPLRPRGTLKKSHSSVTGTDTLEATMGQDGARWRPGRRGQDDARWIRWAIGPSVASASAALDRARRSRTHASRLLRSKGQGIRVA